MTEFTLYYRIADRPADEYRAYCRYVGRLNAVLKPAQPDPQVLLYYPVYDLWAEYLPVADPLQLGSQSPRAQRIVRSFESLGQILQRNQVPFALVDHEKLAAAEVASDGSLVLHGRRFHAVVLPADVELPPQAARAVALMRERGGRVLTDRVEARLSAPAVIEALKPPFRLSPRSDGVAAGHFLRDGRRVILLVNVARQAYRGHLGVDAAGEWLVLDPATGNVASTQAADGQLDVSLAPRQAILLVEGVASRRGP